MVSRNTKLVPSLGLHIGPACEAGLSAGMQRERVPPQKRERKGVTACPYVSCLVNIHKRVRELSWSQTEQATDKQQRLHDSTLMPLME